MRKLILTVINVVFFGAAVAPAFAQAPVPANTIQTCPLGTQFSALCNFTFNSVGNVVSAGITIVLIIAVVIAVFFLLLGGVRWITSGGDKGKVDEARKQIVAAIIGLVVAFLAFFIIRVVSGILNVDVTNLNLPKINP